MSTHPNVILMAALTPDDLPMKTMREILAEAGIKYEGRDGDSIKIGSKDYHNLVMENDYDESWQISSKPGDLLFLNLVTYGYGESITWAKLEKQKVELEQWAQEVCQRHHCSYEIRVTANYW